MKIKGTLRTYLLACFIVFASAACKSTEKKTDIQESTAHIEVAREKLGDNVKFSFSQDRNYVLAETEIAKGSNDLSFSFFVFDINTEKIVLEQQVESGYVKWLSAEEIEVFQTPGIMRRGQTRDDYTQVYNVKTGTSMSKNDWKK